MTRNQIDYLKYVEDVRKNRASENLETAQTAAQVAQAEAAQRKAMVEEAKQYNVPIAFGPFKTEVKLGSALTSQDRINKKYSLQDYLNSAMKGEYVYG